MRDKTTDFKVGQWSKTAHSENETKSPIGNIKDRRFCQCEIKNQEFKSYKVIRMRK